MNVVLASSAGLEGVLLLGFGVATLPYLPIVVVVGQPRRLSGTSMRTGSGRK